MVTSTQSLQSMSLINGLIRNILPSRNRVGGYPLAEQPTSHTTVRTVRYTAVQ